MSEQKRNPLEGLPKTRESIDDQGRPVFDITARTIGPVRARIGNALGTLTMLWFVFVAIHLLQQYPEASIWHWALAIGGVIALHGYLQRDWQDMLKTKTRMRFTESTFAVRKGGSWEVYDRRHPHRFSLVRHDHADHERERLEYEKQKAALARKAHRARHYYGESFFVSFDYLGQRNDLLVVYGRKDAMAIVARLQACDEIMDGYTRLGKGAALDPAAEWGKQPGEISETIH